MLYSLDKASLVTLFTKEQKDYKHLSKPEKLFLNNSNLMYALSNLVDKGTCRETYAVNQFSAIGHVSTPNKGDILLNGRYLFEIGGKGKNYKQIADIQDSYLCVDDIEIGIGNRIPLWMIGMLY